MASHLLCKLTTRRAVILLGDCMAMLVSMCMIVAIHVLFMRRHDCISPLCDIANTAQNAHGHMYMPIWGQRGIEIAIVILSIADSESSAAILWIRAKEQLQIKNIDDYLIIQRLKEKIYFIILRFTKKITS